MSEENRDHELEAYIARVCDINRFPDYQDEVLSGLIVHYRKFSHEGNRDWAEKDVRNAAVLLYWSLEGQQNNYSIQEHRERFGEPSALDVVALITAINSINHPPC